MALLKINGNSYPKMGELRLPVASWASRVTWLSHNENDARSLGLRWYNETFFSRPTATHKAAVLP